MEVRDLKTQFDLAEGTVHAVNGISYTVYEGQVLGIVGESGCGKSVSVLSVMRLIQGPIGRIAGGEVLLHDYDGSGGGWTRDLLTLSRTEMEEIRGNKISMIFQDPMTSLNPVLSVAYQLVEPLKRHRGMSEKEAGEEAVRLLGAVGIPEPEVRIKDYPHQFSGGMRQRAMIAMALSLDPAVLIADEPTTALDVTVQAQILALLERLNRERNLATILITHDLGVVAEVADRVLVMHDGLIVERGSLDEIFYSPRDPYTRKLLGEVMRLDAAPPPRAQRQGETLLEVTDLVKHFPVKRGLIFDREVDRVKAVDGVSFSLRQGETLGLVGESGSGKSTLSRAILQLLAPSSGSVRFEGRDIVGLSRRQLQPLRQQMQMVFQDPYASLNPRKRIGQIVGEPLRLQGQASGAALRQEVQRLLDRVGLAAEHYNRYPHEFSGGQRQRIGIARALALRPKLIIADEPVSALDVSIRAQILDLLAELQSEFGLTYIFVAHDIGVVRHVADRIAVMYRGKIVEEGAADAVCERPGDDYTQKLIAAVPIPDPREARARRQTVGSG